MRRLLIGALLGVLSVLAFVGCSSPPAPASPPSSTAAAAVVTAPATPVFSMSGAFVQIMVAEAPLMADGDVCTGSGDYADVHVGSVISVFDPNGKLLATGAVNSSSYGFGLAEHAASCRLNFTVPAVPDGPPTYGVEIAEHGVRQISSTEAHNTVLISSGP